RWPKGTWRFTDHIDGDGFDDTPIPIKVAITVHDDRLTVDFAGSSPQVKGAINSTLSFVKSAAYLSVRCALDDDVPNNEGVFRCIAAKAPVRVEEYGFAPDSGGPGRFRGGLGLVREYRLLADEAVLQLRADRQL